MENTRTWESKLRFTLQTGFFDQRFNGKAMDVLADGDAEQTSTSIDAFKASVRDYVRTTTVIGEFEGPQAAVSTLRNGTRDDPSGTITLLRGAPKATLLRELGQTLNLEPESILEHFALPRSFRIRSLPSRPPSVATVRFISLGVFISAYPLNGMSTTLRTKLAQQLRAHYQEFLSDDRIGIERCRNISVHDDNFFTVEQQATFFTYGDIRKSWSGILLTDYGRASSSPPWIPRNIRGLQAQFYPLTASGRGSLQAPTHQRARDLRDRCNYHRPDPFTHRACTDRKTMSSEDRELCTKDPMIFLADLLDTSALS
ncbi:hypothetical protein CC80DRAFT_548762 [Byssothecium circinans]|uniref:Uncharacterized protein n=1 Tax=Byssothecium circinans TaxID=147558 RepID=A0A6A5TVK6_9PLEO|nr:hypothetical protein CC80DRAFT_548762 [Byssothecium circinans]